MGPKWLFYYKIYSPWFPLEIVVYHPCTLNKTLRSYYKPSQSHRRFINIIFIIQYDINISHNLSRIRFYAEFVIFIRVQAVVEKMYGLIKMNRQYVLTFTFSTSHL